MKQKEPGRILLPDESGRLTPVKLHESRWLVKGDKAKAADDATVATVFAGEYVKVYDTPILAELKGQTTLAADAVVIGEMVYSEGFEHGTERQFVVIPCSPREILKEYLHWKAKAKGRKYVNRNAETTPE